MSDTLKRLRDLPGVQRVAEICLNPRNFDYPQISYTYEQVSEVSRRLFCISEYDTKLAHPGDAWADLGLDIDDADEEGQDDEPTDEEIEEAEAEFAAEVAVYNEHEAKFQVTSLPWPNARPFWEAIGWDISDGKGNELVCAYLFARQIIAVEGGLVKGARFCPAGDGVALTDDWGDPINPERSLEERLTGEAERYLMERGKKLI